MTSSVGPDSLTPTQHQLINQLFSNLPTDFEARKSAIFRIQDEIHQAMATAIESSFNEYLSHEPRNSVEERKDFAAMINATLRKMSLAIKCPRSGRAATLIVDTQDADHPDISRFRLQVKDPNGKWRRTTTFTDLPLPLTFIPVLERSELESRAAKSNGERGR